MIEVIVMVVVMVASDVEVMVIMMIVMITVFTGSIVVFIKMKSRFPVLKRCVIKHLKLKQNYLVTCSDIQDRSRSNVTSVIRHLYVLMI